MLMSFCCPTILVLILATSFAQDASKAGDKPGFTVSKQTTYLTGPLYPDGNVDYLAGLNAKLSIGVTRENNALVLLIEAAGPLEGGQRRTPEFYRLLGMAEPAEQGYYLLDYSEYHKKVNIQGNDNYSEMSNYISKRRWFKADFPNFASWLDANEKPLRLIEQASKRNRYFRPYVTDPVLKNMPVPVSLMTATMPSLAKARTMIDLLLTRAMLRLVCEKNPLGSWADILTAERLCRLLDKAPALIDHLSVIAFEQNIQEAMLSFLEHAELSREQLQNCLRELDQLPALSTLASKYDTGERCYMLDGFLLLRRQKPETPQAAKALSEINWDKPLKRLNAKWDSLVAALNEPDRVKKLAFLTGLESEAKKVKQTAGQATKHTLVDQKTADDQADLLYALMIPALIKVLTANERLIQIQHNLRVAFALTLYQRDKGSYPDSLASLAPDYLKTVPVDLFSGKPLLYTKTNDGFRFYSVGPNGNDDEGRTIRDDPRGDDLVVERPLPEMPK